MSKKKREKRKRERGAAARRRAETHKSFERTVLDVPEGVSIFSLQSEKAVRIDIIPFVMKEDGEYADKGELYYEKTYWAHRGIGAEENMYVCPAKTAGKKCPICEHRMRLRKDEDADEDLIKDLAPKERQLFRVIDTKNQDKGIQIWDISFHLFGKMLDARVRNADEEDNYGEFYELEGGLTLKCGVAQNSFAGNSFYVVETIDFKTRKEDYEEDVLDGPPDLDEVLKILDYDELKEIFLQTEGADDDENEPKKKSKKKAEVESENEDEEEEDENEEDDEDFENEDEDENEEEEDDENEEEEDDEDFENEDEDEDFEDDDEDEDEEEDDEDEEKTKTKSKSKTKTKVKAKTKVKSKSKAKKKKGKK